MKIYTGNSQHDSTCAVAEAARQVAVAAASTQAAVIAAEVTFYRAVKASALANGLTAELGAYSLVLRSLGTGGV